MMVRTGMNEKGGAILDKETLINRLKTKPDLSLLVAEAMEDITVLSSLLEIVLAETSSVKYASSKIIRMISEQKPELIYPHFEDICRWLHHRNSFIKWDGILALSNLAAVDHEDRFSAACQDYLALIYDPQMITAANAVANAWKIALAKPEKEGDITRRLLEVPKVTYIYKGEPSPECNCIVCGQVLECFEHYFDFSASQAEMISFAQAQLVSRREAVAKSAAKLLRRHSGKGI